jgi:ribA/ribD-fused uncharacterized protein
MFGPDTKYQDAVLFSRVDPSHFLSTYSPHSFELEDKRWPSAEHYYQAAKFSGSHYASRIANAVSPIDAHRLGNVWWRRKRGDFKILRKTLMTRALYSKAVQNSEIAEALLATGDRVLVESSAYEHYWGLGRDQRGANTLGKIWMDVRKKLADQANVDRQGAQGE